MCRPRGKGFCPGGILRISRDRDDRVTTGVHERIYHFCFKCLRKKEKYANSKWILKNLFCCCSNLSIVMIRFSTRGAYLLLLPLLISLLRNNRMFTVRSSSSRSYSKLGIEKKIRAAGSYCMDQSSYFKFLFRLARKFKQSGFFGTRTVRRLGCDSQD